MALKFAALVFLIAAVTDALVIPTVELLQGPSSRVAIVGPDGSTLAAIAPGGTVITNSGIGILAAAPAVLAAAPEVIVAGPSGTIVAPGNTLAGPAIVPADVESATDAVTSPADVSGETENNDGAYVPDNTEQLFDDGSYKEKN